jgi:hypothetical protein
VRHVMVIRGGYIINNILERGGLEYESVGLSIDIRPQ